MARIGAEETPVPESGGNRLGASPPGVSQSGMAVDDVPSGNTPTPAPSPAGERDPVRPLDRGGGLRVTGLWPMSMWWTRRLIVGLIVAALVVGFVGRHGGAVLTSFSLAFAALAIGLLSLPDGDPELD